jgi:serine protease Do
MIDDKDDKINDNANSSNQQQYNNANYEVNNNSEIQETANQAQEESNNVYSVNEPGGNKGQNSYTVYPAEPSEDGSYLNTENQNDTVTQANADYTDTVQGNSAEQEKETQNISGGVTGDTYNFNTQDSQQASIIETGNHINERPNNLGSNQNMWQTQGMPGTGPNNYYKENYKKTNTKKSNAWKYVLVSVVSSLVGAAILAALLLVVAPIVQPQLRDHLGNTFPGLKSQSTQPNTGELKKVEIVQNGESAITSVAEKVGPSVVGIRTSYQNTNELFGVQSEGGEGSGIIISADGYILTNHHVIEGALNDKTRGVRSDAKIEVFLPNKIDKPYSATVQGYDAKTDLAVLKISESNLPVIEFGDSDSIKVGEPAIAIGNPGGLEYMGSVTSGVVSGLNRTVELDGGKRIKLVQTDAAINPGNSGGALVNIKGQLIGVNSIKMVASGFEGLGFAIPVNEAKAIADELIKKTYISKPYLGITVDERYTEDVAKENNMPMGVYVADVEMLGAAQKAGIMAGDVITKFNNKPIKSFDELEEAKNKLKPGDLVKVEIYREGVTKTVQVKLGETK